MNQVKFFTEFLLYPNFLFYLHAKKIIKKKPL